MSSASKQARSERVETSRTERVPAEGTGAFEWNGQPQTTAPHPTVKRARETATDVVSSLGLVALAVLDSADVVGRTAGRIAREGIRDATMAGRELVHEVSHAWHDSLVEAAQAAVDTGIDVSAQLGRGATVLSRQGRELIGAVEHLARGIVGATLGVTVAAPRREPKEPVTAVPIVIN